MEPIFRFATPADAAGILSIYAPYCELSSVSFETVAPTESEMLQRIDRVTAQYPWLVGEAGGRLLGYVYASQHRERAAYRWGVDVAVYIAADHCRRRLATALYKTLFAILREQGYFKAFASVTLPNPASVALHESVGFTPVGTFQAAGYKLGQWRDVGWWQLDLQPQHADPLEPRPVREVCHTHVVRAALGEGVRQIRPAASS